MVECTGFEIRRTGSPVPRVRIPPTPPNGPVIGAFLYPAGAPGISKRSAMKYLALLLPLLLQGCTLLAVADAAGSAVVYGVKTTVNVLDAVTPDIINRKKD